MIVIKIIGGIGNQMFQYALGRAIEIKFGYKVKYDLSDFKNYKLRNFELNKFHTRLKSSWKIENMLLKNILSKFAYKIHLLFPSLLKINKLFYYLEPNKPITSELFDLSDNTYLSGYWQSEKYFRNIKEHLVEELSLFNLPSVENEKYLIEIFNTNSVSIHIRRGDYINDTSAINTHGFCGLDYYVNSISFIESKLSNPTYFVFSDDIDWARHNIKTKKNIFFIDTNFDKPEEDLRLMLNCKHNIIANSSFSWWAAWLNQNKEKIVITPKKWFADSKKSSIDLIPSEWLKI